MKYYMTILFKIISNLVVYNNFKYIMFGVLFYNLHT